MPFDVWQQCTKPTAKSNNNMNKKMKVAILKQSVVCQATV
jgi:hypothetical protein